MSTSYPVSILEVIKGLVSEGRRFPVLLYGPFTPTWNVSFAFTYTCTQNSVAFNQCICVPFHPRETNSITHCNGHLNDCCMNYYKDDIVGGHMDFYHCSIEWKNNNRNFSRKYGIEPICLTYFSKRKKKLPLSNCAHNSWKNLLLDTNTPLRSANHP